VKKINEDLAVKIRYRTTKGTKRHIFFDWVNYIDLSPKEAALFACLATHFLIKYYEDHFADKPIRLTEFRNALKENGMNFEGRDKKLSYVS
jgi:hypothetical protein